MTTANPSSPLSDDIHALATQLAQLLQDLRYGSVELVVHDGKVVQIDKRERIRMPAAATTR
jgi:hypothetical protein